MKNILIIILLFVITNGFAQQSIELLGNGKNELGRVVYRDSLRIGKKVGENTFWIPNKGDTLHGIVVKYVPITRDTILVPVVRIKSVCQKKKDVITQEMNVDTFTIIGGHTDTLKKGITPISSNGHTEFRNYISYNDCLSRGTIGQTFVATTKDEIENIGIITYTIDKKTGDTISAKKGYTPLTVSHKTDTIEHKKHCYYFVWSNYNPSNMDWGWGEYNYMSEERPSVKDMLDRIKLYSMGKPTKYLKIDQLIEFNSMQEFYEWHRSADQLNIGKYIFSKRFQPGIKD
jgi:hypothetical protein